MEVVSAQGHALGIALCDRAQHVHVYQADFITRLGVRALCPAVPYDPALGDDLDALGMTPEAQAEKLEMARGMGLLACWFAPSCCLIWILISPEPEVGAAGYLLPLLATPRAPSAGAGIFEGDVGRSRGRDPPFGQASTRCAR